jgi:hypothetical protein
MNDSRSSVSLSLLCMVVGVALLGCDGEGKESQSSPSGAAVTTTASPASTPPASTPPASTPPGGGALGAPQPIPPATVIGGGGTDLELLDTSFLQSTPFTLRVESGGYDDRGGVLYAFVRNRSSRTVEIAEALVDGVTAPSGTIRWWRAWPSRLDPGQVSTVTVKGTRQPLAEGSRPRLELRDSSGILLSEPVLCQTPQARLTAVHCVDERRKLQLYVRNEGTETVEIANVLVGGFDYTQRSSSALGGPLPPGGMDITTVDLGSQLPSGAPLAIRLRLRWASGRIEYAGAGLRAFDPWFPLGTWDSRMTREPSAQRFFRAIGGDLYTGGSDPSRQQDAYARFGLRNLVSKRISDSEVDHAYLQANGASPAIGAWRVAEEPDLGNQQTSTECAALNLGYWEEAPTKPTFLNAANANAFGEFGPIADIAATDHYVGYDAPTTIPLTWITRAADVEEALWYAEHLKRNVEPRPVWVWSQLASGAWGTQPTAYFVDVQFWSQILAGAKGILWFKYGHGYESDPQYAPAVAEAGRLARMLAPIRDLLLDTEVAGAVASTQPRVEARLLAGRRACVVAAVNVNYQATTPPLSSFLATALSGVSPLHPDYVVARLDGEFEVEVPAWVAPDEVWQVTPGGLVPAAHRRSGNTITIPYSGFHERGLAYVLGPVDQEPPSAPRILGTPDADTISWEGARDDRGVVGYRVLRNGTLVDDVPQPWSDGTQSPGTYTVRAYDGAGNLGPASAPWQR